LFGHELAPVNSNDIERWDKQESFIKVY
jgi:hypothetical protein